jgi:hypothetical protein
MRIRDDLDTALRTAWACIGQPGTWWNAAERVAIAAEARHAMGCTLCAARKLALSPASVAGVHASLGALPDAAVEAIHRIRTDAGRLGEIWFRQMRDAGLGEGQYVELVGIVAVTTSIDSFDFAAGLPERALPAAIAGPPSRRRPRNASPGPGWVSAMMPDARTDDDPDFFGSERGTAHIHLALSLVPNSAIQFWDMLETMYQTSAMMRDFTCDYRAISHAQIELVAARVAALNQCLY